MARKGAETRLVICIRGVTMRKSGAAKKLVL